MSNSKPRRKSRAVQPSSAGPAPDAGRDHVALLLAAAGLVLALVLLFAQRAGGLPGCPVGGGCDLVQSSRFATFLGVPVAAWGAALYAGLCAIAALARLPRRRELLLFGSTAGFALSLYLTFATWRELGATCPYCQGSLLILAALAGWSTWRVRGPAAPWLLTLSLLLSAGAVAGLHLVHRMPDLPTQRAGDPDPGRLAAHVKATGAKFYGASWCPHCQQQKFLFGDAAESLPYVECSPHGPGTPQATACLAAGITSYPTWVIGNRRYPRVLSMAELARFTAYSAEVPRP